jgi:L-amino acid N-acyltransferase YncA
MTPVIRLATARDAAEIAAIYRPAVVAAVISFEVEPPDVREMATRIENTNRRTPWIVCGSGDSLLGYAYATRHRERAAYQWSVDVSAYVHRDARRAGVGTALYTSLFAILVLQGFRNAYAGITLPNAASVGLHRAVGFTPVGVYRKVGYKLGAWHDVEWLERELAPHAIDPAPPIALPEILDSAEFRAALGAGIPLLHRRLARG